MINIDNLKQNKIDYECEILALEDKLKTCTPNDVAFLKISLKYKKSLLNTVIKAIEKLNKLNKDKGFD